MEELGKVLSGCEPSFVIQEINQSYEPGVKIEITKEIIDRMMRYGQFTLGTVNVKLVNKLARTDIRLGLNGEYFSISGFPRALADEEGLQRSTPKMLSAAKLSTDSLI